MNSTNLIESYLSELRKQRYREGTLNTKRKFLSHAQHAMQKRHGISLLNATEAQINEYVDSCGAVTTGKTRMSNIRAFRAFYNKPLNAARVRRIVRESDRNPVPAPTPQKVSEIYQLAGVKSIEAFLFVLLAETGIRIAKAVALTHEEIKADLGLILVNNAKGGKNREVELSTVLICAYRTVFPNSQTTGKIFRFGESNARKIVESLGRKVGIKLAPHALRKYYACGLYYRTKDIMAVKDALGHSNVATTSNYVNRDYKIYERSMKKIREVA